MVFTWLFDFFDKFECEQFCYRFCFDLDRKIARILLFLFRELKVLTFDHLLWYTYYIMLWKIGQRGEILSHIRTSQVGHMRT